MITASREIKINSIDEINEGDFITYGYKSMSGECASFSIYPNKLVKIYSGRNPPSEFIPGSSNAADVILAHLRLSKADLDKLHEILIAIFKKVHNL